MEPNVTASNADLVMSLMADALEGYLDTFQTDDGGKMAKKKATTSDHLSEDDQKLVEIYDTDPPQRGKFASFMLEYGWAILVVIVAIGALAYFGVLDPRFFQEAPKLTPEEIGEREGCNFIVEIDSNYNTPTDCFADVYYNRLRHLQEPGMYCFLTPTGEFIQKCRSGYE